MTELIKIHNNNGRKAVSARELYEKLGYDLSQWARWFKKNITDNQFAVENEDFVQLDTMSRTQDFALSIDFAKKLSMMARTEAGERMRDYFIEIEKQYTQEVLSPAEALLRQVQMMVDHEKKLNALKQRTDVMEDKLNSIMEVRRNTEMELRALPVSVDALPEMGLRDKVRLLVNRYCNACNVAQQTVWDHVYQTLYYTYHVAIKQYTKESKQESWLDVAERKGHMDKIYIIVSNMLKRKGLSNI